PADVRRRCGGDGKSRSGWSGRGWSVAESCKAKAPGGKRLLKGGPRGAWRRGRGDGAAALDVRVSSPSTICCACSALAGAAGAVLRGEGAATMIIERSLPRRGVALCAVALLPLFGCAGAGPTATSERAAPAPKIVFAAGAEGAGARASELLARLVEARITDEKA